MMQKPFQKAQTFRSYQNMCPMATAKGMALSDFLPFAEQEI